MVGKETGGKRLSHGSNRMKTSNRNGRHRNDIFTSHKKRLSGNNSLDNQKRTNASNEGRWWKLHSTFIVVLAVLFGFLNSYHQSTMFENDRHFSHLSSLEREMTFRTEMGLYYSYFKTIIDAPSLWNGIYQIMNDNLTEYPKVINTLQRFNLYPEVLLGVGYRTFQEFARYFDLHTKECWEVIRGDGLHPVESCEGLGEPAYFYTTSVFLLNGLVGSVIFLYGKFLSDSILGGILAASCFFFNHGECTRVQWTPPLRESFGYPLFFLEMLIVTITVRSPRINWNHSVVIAVVTTLFMLFWQFAQFALLTQTLATFGTYVMNFMPAVTLQCILKGQMIGLFAAVILLFRNSMLLASFYASTLITVYIVTLLERPLTKIKKSALILFSQLVLLLVGSLGLKALFSFALNVSDDVHIWNILRSKFTSYRDFHTMLYTCAPEFDFLEQETLFRLTKTLLLPVGLVVYFAVSILLFWKRRKVKDPVIYDDASVMYNLLQFLAFFIMAVVIMRLKLFFTPHLCLITSLIMSKKHFSFLSKTELRYSFVAVLLSLMAVQGIQNIQHQRRILGEYSNPDLEELIMWVNHSTTTEAVFAGSMPTMANLMLSTRRPIVNHPHYEDAGLRKRTYRIYQIYSRKSSNFVYQNLSDMLVNFVVIEKNWCFGKSRDGCAMVDIWDIEDLENKGKESLCQKLLRNPSPFTNVFHNSKYTVLSL